MNVGRVALNISRGLVAKGWLGRITIKTWVHRKILSLHVHLATQRTPLTCALPFYERKEKGTY